jgi:uncharacterized protein YecE (DUF72 family)
MLYAGTSGFSYPSWIGGFYPAGTRRDELLAAYAQKLNSVELHGAVRRLPAQAQFESWAEQTPPAFRFAVKLSERITDQGQLSLSRTFCERVQSLGDRLGPILVQLPDERPRDDGFLQLLLDSLDPGLQYAVELRDESWNADGVDELLAAAGAARVGSLEGTHAFAYLRLREPPYDEEALRALAAEIAPAVRAGRDVYCYFKHEDDPRGAHYAERLLELVATSG